MKNRIFLILNLIILTSIFVANPFFDTEEFLNKVDEITNSEEISGNKIELLKSGELFYEKMEELILQAEETINLQTFIFWEDEVGEHFKDLLIERMNEGIEVNLIVDLWGTYLNSLSFMRELKNNLNFRIHFQISYKSDGLNHSFHEKYLIVDGKYCVFGGANIHAVNLDRYEKKLFGEPEFLPAHTDTNVYLEGPIVREIQKEFIKNWEYLGEPIPENEKKIYFPELECFEDGIDLRFVSQDYTRYRTTYINDLMEFLIENSMESIWLESLYFSPPFTIAYDLYNASGKGIDVKILLNNEDFIDNKSNYSLQTLYYNLLVVNGGNIYEYYETMLHSKVGIFDDQIAVLGTFNMSLRSFFLDAECVLVVEDPEFIEELSDYYFSRIEKSVLIKYEDI